MALRDIYLQAAERGSKLTDEMLAQIMQDNEQLGQHLHLTSLESLAIRSQERMKGTSHVTVIDNGVAVVDLIGPIFPRANMMTMSGATSITQFTSDFIKAYNSPNVNGIVMNVDSPGGDVRGIGDSAKILNKLISSGSKPVKVFASGYMASAAYYVGSVGKELVGSESSINGSIGTVLTAKKNDSGTVEIVSSISPNKRPDAGTEEGRALLQQQVDDLGEIFVKDIAKYRGTTKDFILSNYGQGGVFIGPRAKKQGLLDSISTMGDTIEAVAREAKRATKVQIQGVDNGDVSALLKFESEEIFEMGLKEKFANLFAQAEEKITDPQAAAQSDDTIAAEGQEEAPVSREELEEQFSDAAQLFANEMITDSRIFPSEGPHAAIELLNARIDDELFGGTINMVNAEGEIVEGTREEAVRARYEARPKHTLTQKAVKGIKKGEIKASVLKDAPEDNGDKDGPMSDERRKELLNKTSVGQSVLSVSQK